MRIFAGPLLCVLLSACSVAPVVETQDGAQLTGFTEPATGVAAFLGVPFAEPPVGDRRWAAPQPLPESGVSRDATRFAPACMQEMRILEWYRDMAERFGAPRTSYNDLDVSEDCLYLNIWTPSLATDPALPVMVYIHGGSNNSGWSYEPPYHGQHLAAEGAVVVTVAYRLGVFGFFSHPQLAGEAVANFGLWDQLAALHWIRDNIHAFGGDPDRMLVFGESAGAEDILALLFSESARDLIPRAALQSPAGFGIGQATLSDEQQRGTRLAQALDIAPGNALDALRQVPAARLLSAYTAAFPNYYHSPVIDGELIKESTWDAIRAGRNVAVPLIIGTNADEWLDWIAEDARREDLERRAEQLENIKPSVALAAVEGEHSVRKALDRISTAEEMLCPAQHTAASISQHGGMVWNYFFSRVREGQAGAALGAFHGAEYTYLFGTRYAGMPITPIDRGLQKIMAAYWLNFARHGDPNSTGLPSWPDYSAPVYRAQELGDVVQTIARPESLMCESFDASLLTR